MRLSLWQQFSSHHSSHFSVVGQFSNESDASDAAEKIRQILRAIREWRSVPENRAWIELQHRPPDSKYYYENHFPTPPELDFARQYEIDWGNTGIDWTGKNPDERVTQIGNDVIVGVDFETWNPPTPMQNLLAKLGATVKTQVSES